jgi:hypothetical protein
MSQFMQDHIDAMLRQVPAGRRGFLQTLLLAGAGIGAAMLPGSEVLAQKLRDTYALDVAIPAAGDSFTHP